ncbi:hypothetical protein MASR2M15_03330 [Anaerolineales bacterium]
MAFVFFQLKPNPIPTLAQKEVTILIDGINYHYETSQDTVQALLSEQKIQIKSDTFISESLDTKLYDGLSIIIEHSHAIDLIVDGELYSLSTAYDNVTDILAQENIVLQDHDRIWLDGTEVAINNLIFFPITPQEIVIEHAYLLTLVDEGVKTEFWTTADTIGDALFEEDIIVYLADRLDPPADTSLSANTEVLIHRASPVTLSVDGLELSTRALEGSVADVLAKNGIALSGLDYTIPSEDSLIIPGMRIRVIRVTEEILIETETIPFGIQYQANPEMELDQRAVIQTGQTGIQETHTRVRYENGYKVESEELETIISTMPQDQIIQYGTNIVIRIIDTEDGPLEYWRVLNDMITTSYYPAELGGDDVTAIGMKLQKGVVGIDPKLIPYRTRMYVPGYGIGVAADTGGPRSTRYWIDLGYSDEDWIPWSQLSTVYLLTPVPENINYLLPPR